jgi:hypothetical protein
MKYLIPLTLLAAMFGGVAYANGHGPKDGRMENPCMKPGKVLTKNVDLTEDQRALTEDLKGERKAHKAERHELKRSMKQDRIDALKGYAEGDLSRADINDQIEDKHREMSEKYADMKDGFFALIDSYSEVQKDQVRDNIDDTRQCMADNEEQFESHIERKEAHIQKRFEKKAKFITKDLDLSRNQQAAFDAWQDGQLERFQERMDGRMDHKGQHLEALLDGQSQRSIERTQAERSAEKLEAAQEQADLMMDFVDSLDTEQRDQFVENIDALVERVQNRSKSEKGEKGNGKPRR